MVPWEDLAALAADPTAVLHEPIPEERRPADASVEPRVLGLADYLGAVERFLRRYVAFPSEHEPLAIALWVAHAASGSGTAWC